MRKVYILEDLDCANCAAKIEDSVRALEEVTDVNVSFFTQKMSVETHGEQDKKFLKKIKKIVKSFEPDVCVYEE